ncbi:MAG: hypothetical protein AB203_01635 [Parcubacteria bacterium C7867-008]|nr:MAG: hypothetical protein AB203_01635 [Parcubacteria bacterium C7867-008]
MIRRFISLRACIYVAAIAILLFAMAISSNMARAESGHWAGCFQTWFGLFIGPPECGGPPPGSECYGPCSGLPGFCPADYCWEVFIPDPPACVANAGNSCSSGGNSCGMTGSGTIQCDGACSAATPSDSLCPPPTCTNGSVGPYPACPLPPPSCTNGSPGPYPACPLPIPECTNGSAGPYPACPLPPPTCTNGSVGPYPACPLPLPGCSNGSSGPYPACPLPTCEDLGLVGTYPACVPFDPPTCADFGKVGVYPACTDPIPPTCADSGQLGVWPACYDAPTCADTGQVGVYPACTDPDPGCVADTSCKTNTCVGDSCSDGCGGLVSGTKTDGACTVPADTCTSPTVSIKATPSRVRTGTSATLTVTGSGLNQTCTVTGPGVNRVITPASCLASASFPTPPITKQSVYRVDCIDGATSATVIVNINPIFSPF